MLSRAISLWLLLISLSCEAGTVFFSNEDIFVQGGAKIVSGEVIETQIKAGQFSARFVVALCPKCRLLTRLGDEIIDQKCGTISKSLFIRRFGTKFDFAWFNSRLSLSKPDEQLGYFLHPNKNLIEVVGSESMLAQITGDLLVRKLDGDLIAPSSINIISKNNRMEAFEGSTIIRLVSHPKRIFLYLSDTLSDPAFYLDVTLRSNAPQKFLGDNLGNDWCNVLLERPILTGDSSTEDKKRAEKGLEKLLIENEELSQFTFAELSKVTVPSLYIKSVGKHLPKRLLGSIPTGQTRDVGKVKSLSDIHPNFELKKRNFERSMFMVKCVLPEDTPNNPLRENKSRVREFIFNSSGDDANIDNDYTRSCDELLITEIEFSKVMPYERLLSESLSMIPCPALDYSEPVINFSKDLAFPDQTLNCQVRIAATNSVNMETVDAEYSFFSLKVQGLRGVRIW